MTRHLTLREQGYRFVYRGDQADWIHPLEVRFDDIDCTDMEDDEFAAFVAGRPVRVSAEDTEGGAL